MAHHNSCPPSILSYSQSPARGEMMNKLVTAETEYTKDPNLRPGDIDQLREWVKKQPHLPQIITDEFLIATLHSSEYSVEQGKQLLEANINCRTNYTEMFSSRDPMASDKQAVWNYVDVWISNYVTPEKYRIFYGGLKNESPELWDFPNLLNVFTGVLDTTIREQGVCPGYIVILNCKGFTLSHLTKCNITHIRNVLYYVQEAILLKIKEIHVINISSIIDKIMFVVKPFLKKALLDMLYFHSGEMKDFYKAVPKEYLPQEIGGTKGHQQDLVELTRSRLEQMRDWLIEQEKLVIDQSKRPNGKKDIYSVAGSFRKLDLD